MPNDPPHHRAAVADRGLPRGSATLDSTMTPPQGRSGPPEGSLERLAEDIVFEVRGRPAYLWVDGINATDADQLVNIMADILSRIDWGDRPPKVVRYVHLTDPRQVLADFTAMTEAAPDDAREIRHPQSARQTPAEIAALTATAVARLAEAGPTVLVLFDVGRFLASTRGRGWRQFLQICEASSDARMALVALSSDSSHPDAQRIRDKFHPILAGPTPNRTD